MVPSPEWAPPEGGVVEHRQHAVIPVQPSLSPGCTPPPFGTSGAHHQIPIKAPPPHAQAGPGVRWVWSEDKRRQIEHRGRVKEFRLMEKSETKANHGWANSYFALRPPSPCAHRGLGLQSGPTPVTSARERTTRKGTAVA